MTVAHIPLAADELLSRGRPLAALAAAVKAHDAGGPHAELSKVAAAVGVPSIANPPDQPFGKDRVPPTALIAGARVNLAALAARTDEPARLAADQLQGIFAKWSRAQETIDTFVTPQGSVIRRHADNTCQGLDDRPHTEIDQTEMDLRAAAASMPKPIVIEQLDPPRALAMAWRSTPPTSLGYRTPLLVVEPDLHRALDGLATADLRQILTDQRVSLFVGDAAVERFADHLATRNNAVPPDRTIVLGATDLTGAAQRQHAASLRTTSEHALAAVATRAQDRTPAWWSNRFTSGKPLRVLILTSRYTTFLRHAANDITNAFDTQGHSASIVIEPDDGSLLAPSAYTTAMRDHDPDLVIAINRTRPHFKGSIPDNVPFICWVQDQMPHLYEPNAARLLGELDFLVGHTATGRLINAGYDLSNALRFPIVASEAKFHEGPVDPSLRRELDCDIAYVSHQSQTPAEFHAKSMDECEDPRVKRLLEALKPTLPAVADAMTANAERRVTNKAIRDAERISGLTLDEPTRVRLAADYVRPMLDRILRHQSLRWAADIAKTHDLSMRIWGRGWESVNGLAHLHAGELDHGEPLRAAYQAAGLHLHISSTTLLHQRVIECALSGGVPLGRFTWDIALRDAAALANRLQTQGGDQASAITELRARYAALHIPGAPDPAPPEAFTPSDKPLPAGLHDHTEAAFLGDLAALTFHDRDTMETRVLSLLRDREARQRTRLDLVKRCRARYTYATFVDRLVQFVSDRLTVTAGRRDAA